MGCCGVSWLCCAIYVSCRYHPKLNVLYVLSECIDCNGYLTAYSVDPATGHLSELGRLDMNGKSTCYISFDKEVKHAICTNYWDGVIDVVELNHQGIPVRIVQSHQQTRRETWRQVENREVSTVLLAHDMRCPAAGLSSTGALHHYG